MLINLVPEFLALLEAPDPLEAYHRYLDEHRAILSAYWHNYVLDLTSPHVDEVISRTLAADRSDLRELLSEVDITVLASETISRCEELYEIDSDVDTYLMVGVGGANAGELVVDGRGVAFVCLEHFTGRANPETYGLGLSPELIPIWIAHELAHAVRYTSPSSASEIAKLVAQTGGFYDYWETGSNVTLIELLVNEGLAIRASSKSVPDRDPCDYLGYGRRQYRRLRELEAFLRSEVAKEFGRTGLGYRLRYLSGGVSPASRMVGGKIIPQRAGYYLGYRMVESLVAQRGIARALRASAQECLDADDLATKLHTA